MSCNRATRSERSFIPCIHPFQGTSVPFWAALYHLGFSQSRYVILKKAHSLEEKTPTIRQVWCRLVHSFAEDRQVYVELSIIEGAKGDAHGTPVNGHQPWQLEERAEP